MGAVIDFVGDVFDAVGDVVEAVGDFVEDVVEAVGDVVDYVVENPEIIVIAVAAPYAVSAVGGAIGASQAAITLATQPVTAAAISASQGGDLEDIGKAALGSFLGQGVGTTVAKQVGTAIGASGNVTQTALANAVGGATGSAAGAAVTGQDIGEAALMGAAGSAGASLARSGAVELGQQPQGVVGDVAADIGEAVGRTAAGGELGQELLGAAFTSLSREGQLALQELMSRPQTEATKQAIAAFSQPRSPGVGEQLGEALAQNRPAGYASTEPEQIGDLTARKTGQYAVDGTLPEVVVTASKFGEEGGFGADVRTGKTIPSSLSSSKAKAAGTAGGVTTPASQGGVAGGAREPSQMTGTELLQSAGGGGGGRTGRLPNVDVTGERELDSLPPVEVIGEEEMDRLPNVDVTGEEEVDYKKLSDEDLIRILNQQFPLTEPELDFEPIDVRRAGGSVKQPQPVSISPRVVGSSPVAAIVGEKEPIFGGEPDPQQDVWNVRSLRLRKALGL
jgi:hypothetical protein